MRRVKFKVVSVSHGRRYSAYAEGNYNLYYLKDEIVRAREGTLGIAVFRTRYFAERFCSERSMVNRLKIIRVRPVGRGKNVRIISRFTCPSSLNRFYERYRPYSIKTMNPPCGTMFYPAVEVLE